MRTAHHIEWWFESGAAHAVLGTLAIIDQSLLAEVSARYPGAILANIATKDGYVMIDGWRTQTAFRPQDIVYDLQMTGVAGIIHFDINRRTGDAATSLALTMEMARDVIIPVYSSGTVNDLTRAVAHRRERPYFVLATAASMNGYTSAIVALLENGLKTTRAATPPVAVFADPLVLAKAPAELTLAGLGDLISKPYCGCDWKIASLVRPV